MLFAVYNFGNISAMRFIFFFSKSSKFDVDLRNLEKENDRMFRVSEIIEFEFIAWNTYPYRERILVIISP